MKVVLILGIAFFCSHISAQDLKKDFEALEDLYKNLENFYTKMEVKIYDLNENKTVPHLIKHCEVNKKGNMIVHHTDDISMVNTDQSLLILDHKNKVIAYGESDKKAKKQKLDEMLLPNTSLDSLMQFYEEINYKGIIDNCKVYHLKFKKLAFSRAVIEIDQETGFLKMLSYSYDSGVVRQKIWVETNFSSTTATPEFDVKIFDKNHYLKKEGDGYVGVGKYKNYRVVKLKNQS